MPIYLDSGNTAHVCVCVVFISSCGVCLLFFISSCGVFVCVCVCVYVVFFSSYGVCVCCVHNMRLKY